MLETTVEIQPYVTLCPGDEHIKKLEIQGLSKKLTEDLQAAHLKNIITAQPAGTDGADQGKAYLYRIVTVNKHTLEQYIKQFKPPPSSDLILTVPRWCFSCVLF